MKRLVILAAALALTACGPGKILSAGNVAVPPPVTVANRTILDEQIGKGAEIAYKACRTMIELATDAGLIKGAAAGKAAELDNALYGAIEAVRTAYRAGNATGYADAAEEVKILAGQLTDLVQETMR